MSDNTPLAYVRKHYGVPAEIGRRVVVSGRPGIIAADRGHYIGVNFDDDKPGAILNAHPTSGRRVLEPWHGAADDTIAAALPALARRGRLLRELPRLRGLRVAAREGPGMTFDLFAEPEAPAPAAAPAAVESFMMQPTGEPNRWQYRGVLVACDMARQGYIGHWHTVEPLGCLSIVKSDTRRQLCRAIDTHLGPRPTA